jgi:hypothetical protein
MRSAEKLFELLDDSDSTTLTIVPRDANGKSRGVIVVVHERQMDEFLAVLDEHWVKKTTDDEFGWDDV